MTIQAAQRSPVREDDRRDVVRGDGAPVLAPVLRLDELLPVDAEEIRHYKELLDLGDRLKKVSNEEEWMKLLSELRSLKRG